MSLCEMKSDLVLTFIFEGQIFVTKKTVTTNKKSGKHPIKTSGKNTHRLFS